MFILTGLNVWEWLALAGSVLLIGGSAVWVHRRDRRRLRR
jgi:hypothetical protein